MVEVTVETITDEHLQVLFATHCECRPLDLWRTRREHSHDCDLDILDDVRKAGGWLGVIESACRDARLRCVDYWNTDLASDIYAPLLAAAWNARRGGDQVTAADKPRALPEILLVRRDTWTGNDGKPYVHEKFEIRGGDIADNWLATLRPPALPWCEVGIWNEEPAIGSYGGEVWPSAWPEFFEVAGRGPHQRTILTPAAIAAFTAARQNGVQS